MKRDPLVYLPDVPTFTVTATDVNDDQTFKPEHYSREMGVEGGKDQSPALTFTDVPANTRSLVVQIYDPDAPTLGGYWHWTLINIPGETQTLVADAGQKDKPLVPSGAVNMPNDAGFSGYVGAAPPAGETHRYFIVVSALDVEILELDEATTPNVVNFQMNAHVIGRAVTIVEGSTKE